MSLVLMNSHFGNLLNHMQILTEKTWTQTQGVENLEIVVFVFVFGKEMCDQLRIP